MRLLVTVVGETPAQMKAREPVHYGDYVNSATLKAQAPRALRYRRGDCGGRRKQGAS